MSILQTIWPRCRFIHLLRHGVPTAVSMSRHQGFRRMAQTGMDSWVPLSQYAGCTGEPVPTGDWSMHFAGWARRIRRIRDEATRLADDSYMEVKFEDLLHAPEHVLKRIAAFSDLSSPDPWIETARRLIDSGRSRFERPSDFSSRVRPRDMELLRDLGYEG